MVSSGSVPRERLDELRSAVESTHRTLGVLRWRTTRLSPATPEDRLVDELAVLSRALHTLLAAAEAVASTPEPPRARPGSPGPRAVRG
ncbi:hypothetical protein [Embleya sp. NPDC059237]|uniref:hypothetical protein n=1 Tax=Embleya sp. NPDC059237 TaxID=3346784 RepID=UPI00369215A9